MGKEAVWSALRIPRFLVPIVFDLRLVTILR